MIYCDSFYSFLFCLFFLACQSIHHVSNQLPIVARRQHPAAFGGGQRPRGGCEGPPGGQSLGLCDQRLRFGGLAGAWRSWLGQGFLVANLPIFQLAKRMANLIICSNHICQQLHVLSCAEVRPHWARRSGGTALT